MLTYFAYGSNMYTPRLRERVPGCQALGTAHLPGYQLRFQKRSKKDGSAKANAFHTGGPHDAVIGVLFSIPESELRALDLAEGNRYGYERCTVSVLQPDGASVLAITYLATADAIDDGLVPLDWYTEFVALGAREHGLPLDYVAMYIEAVDSLPDPDTERADAERRKLRF